MLISVPHKEVIVNIAETHEIAYRCLRLHLIDEHTRPGKGKAKSGMQLLAEVEQMANAALHNPTQAREFAKAIVDDVMDTVHGKT